MRQQKRNLGLYFADKGRGQKLERIEISSSNLVICFVLGETFEQV